MRVCPDVSVQTSGYMGTVVQATDSQAPSPYPSQRKLKIFIMSLRLEHAKTSETTADKLGLSQRGSSRVDQGS